MADGTNIRGLLPDEPIVQNTPVWCETHWWDGTAQGIVCPRCLSARVGVGTPDQKRILELEAALRAALDEAGCDCPRAELDIGGRGHLADCWTAKARAALAKADGLGNG